MGPGEFVPPARRAPCPSANWAPAPNPPFELEDELKLGTDEVLATLSGHRWLFPPAIGEGPPDVLREDGGDGREASAREELRGGAPPQHPDALAPGYDRGRVQMEALAHEYEFTFMRSEAAQRVVRLLFLVDGQPAHDSRPAKVLRNIKAFTTEAYKLLTAGSQQAGISDDERQSLMKEAQLAIQALVKRGALCVATDFILCIEAFDICRGRPAQEQTWLGQCIHNILEAAGGVAPEPDVLRWLADIRRRIQNEPELYVNMDVRSWPCILKLAKGDSQLLDAEAFKRQVQLQLCIAHDYTRYDGLKVAAKLIADLRQAANLGAESIGDIFNDKQFDRSQREGLLGAALQGAPRSVVQAVLRKIDGDDVDVAERNDEEIKLVTALLQRLDEDIRCCKHAYFRMKNDWIAGRWGGVVTGEELSPEQICDHIENEENHHEHLKAAVNKCLKLNRKFEAARMLARRASLDTSAFEANRNDKQLAYLVSLYNDLEAPTDEFGPIEEGCLALPIGIGSGNLLYVDEAGDSLQQLKADLLDQQPTVVGVWWCWRCFDPKLDLWPKASFVSLAYNDKLVIVDFMSLERMGKVSEEQGKKVVCDILAAQHLLKVTHNVDRYSLKVLQRALVPLESDNDAPPEDACVSPLVDLAVVAALVRRTRPGAACVSKLSGLTFDYLRLELCLAEALSNFERRPLRQSQRHYALALAWSPVMVLRALCAHGVVTLPQVTSMSLRLGLASAPEGWDDMLRRMPLSSDPAAEYEHDFSETAGLQGAYGKDLWGDAEWVAAVPRPDHSLDVGGQLRRHLEALALPPEHAQAAQAALRDLFVADAASRQLAALYEAFQTSQASKHGDN